MELKNMISLVVFGMFFGSYMLKILIQASREKINPVSLGKRHGQKASKTVLIEQLVRGTTLIWGLVWLMEILFDQKIHNFLKYLMLPFTMLGLILSGVGVLFFVVAMVDMGKSWRVGIDKEHQTELVREGIYKFSRNPAFVGFDLMFVGMFLTFPDLLTLVVMVMNVVAMHLLILREEEHLQTLHGERYVRYMGETCRYLFF